jgi:hypothetical protein
LHKKGHDRQSYITLPTGARGSAAIASAIADVEIGASLPAFAAATTTSVTV